MGRRDKIDMLKTSLCLAIAIGSLLVASACGGHETAAAEGKPADAHLGAKLANIPTALVESVPVYENELSASAVLELNQNRQSHVVLPLPGRIQKVLVSLGDSVRQGQALVTIESPDADVAESAYLQATATISQSQAAVLKAQADLQRATDLFEHGAIPKKDVLNAEHQVVQTTSGVQTAEALREQALRKLRMLGLSPGTFGQHVSVQAPVAGKVLSLGVVAGEFRNDINATLMTIADLSTLWMTTNIPEAYIRFCRLGGAMQIELTAFPGEKFSGRVTQIGDTVDPQMRTVKVRAELANPRGKFLPEMYGQVKYLDGQHMAPVVNSASLVQFGGKSYVFIEETPDKFVRREVTAGRRMGDRLIILSGVKPGDRIATEGAIYLREMTQ